ncbi:unnamed protein product [Echinostoma caproni]|uniref:Vigilin n=1 Tax=Echinostoma caproni TaxID=27848 RepID=A0A183AEP1_9TREM|nr:unnamed protein product [Echinostoma caproni]
MDKIRVDPKYFRHIIGRQGAMILRLRENKVQIRMPTLEKGDHLEANEIVIEGDPQGVERTKKEILQLVEKLENEKCKDVIIEPRVQHLLCTGYKNVPPPIRSIYDSFPKVSFLWPDNQDSGEHAAIDNPARSLVQLRGDRQQVDAAAERLQKLIKQVIEENHRQEIRIFKEFRPLIFGRGSAKIQKLLDDTKTRIQYPNPSDGSDVFTIIGREENVQQAIRQLEDLQKQLADVKEIIVSIPSALTTKFVGDQAPSLRSIREQCAGVHMRFVNPPQKYVRKGNQVEVVVIGPSEALKQAQQLLNQLNAKVAQLCAEELVHVDPKFHGFLIGRQGSNITRFRERHNVELLFPDRMETDPKLSMEIRIVGPKEAVAQAKADLEAMIKTLEDEIEQTIPVDPAILKDIVVYRRSFPNPELDRVRVIMPRSAAPRTPSDAATNASGTSDQSKSVIKLIGQKACVESASQALQNMIRDIEEQTTKEFQITDPNQFIALDRSRTQFRDLEHQFRVFINLRRTMDSNSFTQTSPEKVNDSHMQPSGTLFITGRPDRIDQLYEEEIRPMLPIEEEFPLSQEFHRGLIVNPSTERQRNRGAQPAPPTRGRRGTQQPENTTAQQPTNETPSKAAEIKQKYNVLIRLPPQQAVGANQIYLRGTPSQIASAKAELVEWTKHCEELKADRIARNFELSFPVPTRFMAALMALRRQIEANHEVFMRAGPDLPSPNVNGVSGTQSEVTTNGFDLEVNANHQESTTEEDNSHVQADEQKTEQLNGNHASDEEDRVIEDTDKPNDAESQITTKPPHPDECAPSVHERMSMVILRGYQHKAEAAKAELETTIQQLLSQVTEELWIPAAVHPQLIGSRGYAIQKVMSDFHVRIEFPNRNARETADANRVLVTGDQKDVDLACDVLISRANELLDRLHSENRPAQSKQYREELLPTNGSLNA